MSSEKVAGNLEFEDLPPANDMYDAAKVIREKRREEKRSLARIEAESIYNKIVDAAKNGGTDVVMKLSYHEESEKAFEIVGMNLRAKGYYAEIQRKQMVMVTWAARNMLSPKS